MRVPAFLVAYEIDMIGSRILPYGTQGSRKSHHRQTAAMALPPLEYYKEMNE